MDLISRQAAIDALDRLCDDSCIYSKKQRNIMCGACSLGGAFDVIEALPSAQPERKGKWLFVEYPDGYYHTECSECGQWFDEDVYLKDKWRYCPNCGADMRGEEK